MSNEPIKIISKPMLITDLIYLKILRDVENHSDFDELNSYFLDSAHDAALNFSYKKIKDYLELPIDKYDTGLQLLLYSYRNDLNKLSSYSDQIQYIINLLTFYVTWNQIMIGLRHCSFGSGLSVVQAASNVTIFNNDGFAGITLHLYSRSDKYNVIFMYRLTDMMNFIGTGILTLVRRPISATNFSSNNCVGLIKLSNIDSFEIDPKFIEDEYNKHLDHLI